MNRFRRLLIRWEKKVENYTAMLHLEPIRNEIQLRKLNAGEGNKK